MHGGVSAADQSSRLQRESRIGRRYWTRGRRVWFAVHTGIHPGIPVIPRDADISRRARRAGPFHGRDFRGRTSYPTCSQCSTDAQLIHDLGREPCRTSSPQTPRVVVLRSTLARHGRVTAHLPCQLPPGHSHPAPRLGRRYEPASGGRSDPGEGVAGNTHRTRPGVAVRPIRRERSTNLRPATPIRKPSCRTRENSSPPCPRQSPRQSPRQTSRQRIRLDLG